MSRSDETGWYSSGCQAEPLPTAPRALSVSKPKFAPTFNAPQPVILHEAVQHRLHRPAWPDAGAALRNPGSPGNSVRAWPVAGRCNTSASGWPSCARNTAPSALTSQWSFLERKQVPGLQQAFGNGHGMYTGQVPVARSVPCAMPVCCATAAAAGWRAVGNPQDTFQHVRDLGGRQPMVAMAALRDGDQQIAFDQATQMRCSPSAASSPGHTCQFHRGCRRGHPSAAAAARRVPGHRPGRRH